MVIQVYMKVTNDKYELPIAVADSIGELSKICGNNKNVISSSLSHKTGRFRKVEIDEDEEE